MQNEGDCPKGYGREQRLRCPWDCQDTYLSFVFSAVDERIVREGALMNNGKWHYNLETLRKHGFDPQIMEVTNFIAAIWNGISHDKGENGEKLVYRGDELAFKPVCGFVCTDAYLGPDPEAIKYQELIRRHPQRILEQGGIEFHGSILTFKPENIRDRKSAEADEPTSPSR